MGPAERGLHGRGSAARGPSTQTGERRCEPAHALVHLVGLEVAVVEAYAQLLRAGHAHRAAVGICDTLAPGLVDQVSLGHGAVERHPDMAAAERLEVVGDAAEVPADGVLHRLAPTGVVTPGPFELGGIVALGQEVGCEK